VLGSVLCCTVPRTVLLLTLQLQCGLQTWKVCEIHNTHTRTRTPSSASTHTLSLTPSFVMTVSLL